MYVIDLFKRLTSKQNIPVLIYIILNFIVSGLLVFSLPAMFGESDFKTFLICLGIGIVVYALSVFIALSPIGEFILRIQTGCKKIKRKEQINFLEPIFREVYEKARRADPSIPEDVQLFINIDDSPNAFATGRRTVCVTKGLLDLPEEQIKATLAHEFGHIAHKDTDLIMLVSVGNLIVSGFILAIRAIIGIFQLFMSIAGLIMGGSEGAVMNVLTALGHLLVTLIIGGLTKLWTQIGIWLVMKSSRDNEYLADEFSFNLGYGDSLCRMLDSMGDSAKAEGLFAALSSSHPDNDDRIARLQDLGASYRASYGTGSAGSNTPLSIDKTTQNDKSTILSKASFSQASNVSGTDSSSSQSGRDKMINYHIQRLSESSFCDSCSDFSDDMYCFIVCTGEKTQTLHVCKNCALKLKKRIDSQK